MVNEFTGKLCTVDITGGSSTVNVNVLELVCGIESDTVIV